MGNFTITPKIPTSKWRGEACSKNCQVNSEKGERPSKGITYRSTPLACGFWLAELLMGRRLRTSMPTFQTNLTPKWPDMGKLKAKEDDIKAKQLENFNQRDLSHPLSPLEPDTPIFVMDKDTTGVVIGPAGAPRSYLIDTPTGTVRRNRNHLTPDQGPNEPATAEQPSSPPPHPESPVRQPPSPCFATRPKKTNKTNFETKGKHGSQVN